MSNIKGGCLLGKHATSVMFNPLGEEEFKVDYWEDFPFNDLYEIDYSGGERYDWWLNTLDEWSTSVEDCCFQLNWLTSIVTSDQEEPEKEV